MLYHQMATASRSITSNRPCKMASSRQFTAGAAIELQPAKSAHGAARQRNTPPKAIAQRVFGQRPGGRPRLWRLGGHGALGSAFARRALALFGAEKLSMSEDGGAGNSARAPAAWPRPPLWRRRRALHRLTQGAGARLRLAGAFAQAALRLNARRAIAAPRPKTDYGAPAWRRCPAAGAHPPPRRSAG